MNIIKFQEKMYGIKIRWWQRLYLQCFYAIGYCFSREIRREVQFSRFLAKFYKFE